MPMAYPERLTRPLYILLLSIAPGQFGHGLQASPAVLMMKSGTPVKLRLAETISSAHARKGDRLEFEVVKDVIVRGFTVIRSGSRAQGTVVGVKGRRPLGMGGDVAIELNSVELGTGRSVGLVVRRNFKGRSHILRMGMEMAIAGAVYWPAAPVFLLSRGQDSSEGYGCHSIHTGRFFGGYRGFTQVS
jgi:hypothetical protein